MNGPWRVLYSLLKKFRINQNHNLCAWCSPRYTWLLINYSWRMCVSIVSGTYIVLLCRPCWCQSVIFNARKSSKTRRDNLPSRVYCCSGGKVQVDIILFICPWYPYIRVEPSTLMYLLRAEVRLPSEPSNEYFSWETCRLVYKKRRMGPRRQKALPKL